MNKHTPGPWAVYLNQDTNQFEVFHDEGRGYGRMLAHIVGERSSFEANARLVAAAPDLLAACEAALDWFVSVAADGAPATTVRAAIAKVRGE
jgi:hypothetical protein